MLLLLHAVADGLSMAGCISTCQLILLLRAVADVSHCSPGHMREHLSIDPSVACCRRCPIDGCMHEHMSLDASLELRTDEHMSADASVAYIFADVNPTARRGAGFPTRSFGAAGCSRVRLFDLSDASCRWNAHLSIR